MATVANNMQEEDPDKQVNPTTGGTADVGETGGTGTSGAAAPVSNVKQGAGGQNQAGYTDVGSYLDANKAGTEKMGQDVASNLTTKYNQTKSGIDTSANDFINQVNQGYTKGNDQLIRDVASNPNAAANDPNQLAAFQAQLNDQYTGPNSYGDYGTQQGNIASAQQYGNLNQTPGGMNVLAQGIEGPQASQGVNQLDTMLLQGSPGASQAIKTASDPYAGLTDYLNSKNAAGNAAISSGQNAANTASANALNAFTGENGTLTNLNKQVNAGATAADNARNNAITQQASLKSALQGVYDKPVDPTMGTIGSYGGGSTPWENTTNYNAGTLSPQVLQQLGLTQEQGTALQQAMQQQGTSHMFQTGNFGAWSPTSQTDLTQYLQQQAPGEIQAGTTATPEQYAQMNSIQSLLGSKTPQGNAINPALASLAGTYQPNGSNKFDYDAALANAQNMGKTNRDYAQQTAAAINANADTQHAATKKGGIVNTIKNAVNNPGKILNPNQLGTLKNALKGEVPTGDNPLPNKEEQRRLGYK